MPGITSLHMGGGGHVDGRWDGPERRWGWWRLSGVLLGSLLALSACGGRREVAVQDAALGDPLVEVDGVRVALAKTFQPGVSNGLYKGAVRVSGRGQMGEGTLYALNAVCSLEDSPGWPPYDNLFGYPIAAVSEAEPLSAQQRWQILYHFDGRIESKGELKPQPWMARLKDNLCRRGDFNDSTARPAPRV